MNWRRFRILCLVVLVVGVAAASVVFGQAAPAPGPDSVAGLRAAAHELVLQQSEMGWRSYVQGDSSDQASLYRKYEYLFTEKSIKMARAAWQTEPDADQKRALEFFLHYLETEYVGDQTAELNDIETDLEAALPVLVGGKLVPYRELDGLIANEPDRARRAVLSAEEYRTYRLLNAVILNRLLDKSHRLAKELGYADYLALAVSAKMFDLEDMLAKGREFLDLSEKAYLKLFDEVSTIPRAEFRRSDISPLLSAKSFDRFFPKDNLMPAAYKLFEGLGLGEIAHHKIQVDDRPLPTKVPRAACFPIRVPQDVRLTIKPIGGVGDYSALFHEFGHAQHFANSTTPIWEFQQLGTNAVTEAYAYLMESMPERETWLAANTTMTPAERAKFRRQVGLAKLYMARRYLAKVLYETELHRGVAEPQKRYQYWLSRAYGFQLTDEESTRYLTDLDSLLYAADYAQAFYLEAMLDTYLRAHFGAAWWTNKKAGEFLQGLWKDANKWTGIELAHKLGFPGFDNKLLFDYIMQVAGEAAR